jgi:hypothetical protein
MALMDACIAEKLMPLANGDLAVEIRPPDRHAIGCDGQHEPFATFEA